MTDFHFLRPLWLLLLPVACFFAWQLLSGRGRAGGWQQVVDEILQPHVLAGYESLNGRRLPVLLGLAAAILITLALAGPAWERLPVPAFRSDEALVVAMDLSRSMDAGDVEPSRLARAKLKLFELLERRANGQTALVVFSAHAFTVSPLTTDTDTVAALVGSLQTDIMPSQGSYPEAGLERAANLLEQAGMTAGQILFVTDADVSPRSLELAGELRGRGFETSVLAVGTADGAPIAELDGGFLTDDRGQVVVPQLNADGLRRLALTGGGRFAALTADSSDLDALFTQSRVGELDAGDAEESYEADVWRDSGVWIALLLLPFVAAGFRRGWVYGLALVVILPGPEAQAFEWRDLWQRADQQAAAALADEDPDRAARLFKDPEWGAAASYRSGDFSRSAQRLAGIDTPAANYNRGNAFARGGDLQAAIGAYDRALELDPGHADAQFNRDLVRELLDQQQQQEQQQQNEDPQSDEQDSGQPQAQAGEDPSDQSEQGQSDSEPGEEEGEASSDNSDQRQAESDAGDSPADSPDDQQPPGEQPEPEAGDPGDEQLQASVAPEDVEDWASEQAADQWLRRIPQDPGGLLRRKFLYQYQRLGVDQEGNYVWPGDEAQPW